MDKPKILLDTNIVIDFLQKRQPFYLPARQLFNVIEAKEIDGYLCANSVTTIYFLLTKFYDKSRANIAIEYILDLFHITPVNKSILLQAQQANAKDFEDAVIFCSAYQQHIDAIVTRNTKDFQNSKVAVYSPDEVLAWLNL